MSASDNYFNYQWHLQDASKVNLNIGDVWSTTGGAGVSVAVVDDGIQTSHSRLSDATAALAAATARSTGVGANPTDADSNHGTAVAGIIAGKADTSGPVGVAPGVDLASVRIFGNGNLNVTDGVSHFGEFDIASNSWGYSSGFYRSMTYMVEDYWARIFNHMDSAIDFGRDGLGTIVVKSAGNSRESGRMATDDYLANHKGTVVVGAVDHTGEVAYYSTPGSNLLVSAPSSGAGQHITTTDRTGSAGYGYGDTTSKFGGTSAAAPMVSGVAALVLEANPGLKWHDVQDILAISATHVGSTLGRGPVGDEQFSWLTNGADHWNGGGMHFSNDYGYGLVDAYQAVRLAETWNLGRAAGNETEVAVDASAWTYDHARGAAQAAFTVSSDMDMFTAVLNLNSPVDFTSIDQLVLISPDGTQSVLYASDGDVLPTTMTYEWDFLSQAFRGEDSTGTWKMDIRFTSGSVDLDALDAQLTLSGQAATENDVYYYTSEFAEFGSRTLTDASGTDTINTAAIKSGVVVDLTPGATSTIDGASLTISSATGIENAVTGAGNDTITGNDLDNGIWSGQGDDTVFGGAGNDLFVEGAGADIYDGGAGTDMLAFELSYDADAFLFAKSAGAPTISITHHGETDMLTSVERVAFNDGTQIAFDNDGSAGAIYRLYQTAFDREPDAASFADWVNVADSGTDLASIAKSFTLSQEYIALYGIYDEPDAKVSAFYTHSLEREPDDSGLQGWVSTYETNGMDDVSLLLGFSESAESVASSSLVFDDGYVIFG